MRKIILLTAAVAFSSSVWAASEPTVTLTQAELQMIVDAAIADSRAEGAIQKARAAFAPAPSATAPATQGNPEKK